jgi:hypothetical protein
LWGSKFYQLISEESHHSKREEFRRLALSDNMNECSNLLRRMELEDSDSEVESVKSVVDQDEAVLSLGEMISMKGVAQAEIVHDGEGIRGKLVSRGTVALADDDTAAKKMQKRKWGPTQRVDRSRRVLEDGKTMLQRAHDLKKVRNSIKGMAQKTSLLLKAMKI